MIIIYLIFITYLSFMLYFGLYQRSRTQVNSKSSTELPTICLLVPFRNEADRIQNALESISAIEYPKEKLEIIFWNDASTDHSERVVNEFVSSFSKYKCLLRHNESQLGKKKIIDQTVRSASENFDWILLCDADTVFKSARIKVLAQHIDEHTDLLLGRVVLSGEKFIQKAQALEFDMMSAIAKGSANLGKPILGSSANLMFRRESYLNAEPYESNFQLASGDDVFLIQAFKKLRSNNVKFIDVGSTYVSTEAEAEWKKAIFQKLRWASKNPKVRDPFYELVAWVSLLVNVILLVQVALFKFYPEPLFICWALKTMGDIFLLSTSGRFNHHSVVVISLFAFLYPFYVTFVALFSFLIRPPWR